MEQKRLLKIYLIGQYVAIGCAVRWKRKKRYFGDSLDVRIRRHIKHNLTFQVQSMNVIVTQNEAKKVMVEFFKDLWYLNHLFYRHRVVYTTNLYI